MKFLLLKIALATQKVTQMWLYWNGQKYLKFAVLAT
jgi:hypothetical protein